MGRFTRIASNRRKKRSQLVVFISTGDTCRGPMAAGYFSKLLAERGLAHIEVRDAGIMTVPGLKATPEAIQVLDTVDVDLRRHSSRKLSNESVKRADLILGMSSFHVQSALRQSDVARSKTFLFKEYVGFTEKNVQISDPMGGTLEVYKKCFQEIKRCCDLLIEHGFITGDGKPVKGEGEGARRKDEMADRPTDSGVKKAAGEWETCLLYTSDAADE